MEEYLGPERLERSNTDDYCNSYKSKRIDSNMIVMALQNLKSTFKLQVVKKHQKDIADIDEKIISVYTKV